jgi:hypothetical protein
VRRYVMFKLELREDLLMYSWLRIEGGD